MSQDLPVDQRPDLIDNEIEASRAPLLDHLNELRSRLMKALIAFMVCAIGCFFIAGPIFNILVDPFIEAFKTHGVTEDPRLIYTAPLEFFFVKLKIALFAGLFVSFPIMAWQVYAFVAPGLYKEEKGAFSSLLDCGARALHDRCPIRFLCDDAAGHGLRAWPATGWRARRRSDRSPNQSVRIFVSGARADDRVWTVISVAGCLGLARARWDRWR